MAPLTIEGYESEKPKYVLQKFASGNSGKITKSEKNSTMKKEVTIKLNRKERR